MEWEKLSANHISDKGLVFSIYIFKKPYNSKRQTKKKTSKGFEQTFFKKRQTNGQYPHEEMFSTISIREI